MDTALSILAIEDNQVDFQVLNRALQTPSDYHLIWAKTLAQGLVELSEKPIDIILLDLSLPDSWGLESITSLSTKTTAPVVVLTGLDDENIGITALQHGVQDFLVKGEFDAALLVKTIRYAIERNRLLHELSELKESNIRIQRELEQEQRRVQTTFPTVKNPETAKTYRQNPLKEIDPNLFDHLIKQYSDTLDHALEQRGFKVEYDVSQELRVLADILGSYKATPRDVVELHTATLSSKTDNLVPGKRKVCNEEGRYLLMGLLGQLCSFYRNNTHTLPSPNPIETSVGSEQSILGNI